MKVIIAYDISDSKRLRKVAKLMENYGLRVQYSFFEADLNEKDIIKIRQELENIITKKEDRVIIIRLCKVCYSGIETLGIQQLFDFTPDEFIV